MCWDAARGLLNSAVRHRVVIQVAFKRFMKLSRR